MVAVELNSGTIGYMEEWVYNLIWPIIERLPDELLEDLRSESQASHEKYLELLGPVLKDLPEWVDGYSPKGKFELRDSLKEEGPFLEDVDEFVDAWAKMLQQMYHDRYKLAIETGTSENSIVWSDSVYRKMKKRIKEEGIRLDLYVPEE